MVEDEPAMAAGIGAALRSDGLAVDVVGDVALAREALSTSRYAVMLLDRRLPDGDGLDLIQGMCDTSRRPAIIVLSALDGPENVIAGLDAGAADYLSKPFDMGELRARVRVALRHHADPAEPTLRCGNVTLDAYTRNLRVAGRPVTLKRREIGLLESLLRRVGRVVPRDVLLEESFGFDDEIQSNTLDAHISRLRARLRDAEATASIITLRGLGYTLRAAVP